MPFDTKTLKRDGSGITPVPQYFNPTADDYEAILGRNGASRVEIYGPDGTPIGTTDGALLTQLSGSYPKVVKTTVLNAVTVAPGGNTGHISMGLTGQELETWVLVVIDKQPWSLWTSGGNTNAFISPSVSPIYPRRNNHTSTYVSVNNPSTHFFYGMRLNSTGTGEADPTTLEEAKKLAMPIVGGTFRIDNKHATDVATITVMIVRRLA